MSVPYFSTPIEFEEIDRVLYHARCPDGATSAFCAYSILGDRASYIACSYDNTSLAFENAEAKNLLFIDFSLKRDDFIKLRALAKNECKRIQIFKIQYNNQPVNLGFIECPDKAILNDVAIYALKHMEIEGLMLNHKQSDTQNKFSLRRLRANNKMAMHKIAEQFSGGGHDYAASFFSSMSLKEILDSIQHEIKKG